MIWHRPFTLEQVNDRARGNMGEHLNIVFTAFDDNSLTATMPVDHTTKQPFGLLHGGASVALAETVGSTAANLCVDPDQSLCVGMEINANHVRAVRQGLVQATARPRHLGRRSQVWEIEITDTSDRLVCISRLTMAVVDRKGK